MKGHSEHDAAGGADPKAAVGDGDRADAHEEALAAEHSRHEWRHVEVLQVFARVRMVQAQRAVQTQSDPHAGAARAQLPHLTLGTRVGFYRALKFQLHKELQ